MKGSRGTTFITILLMLTGSLLTLFAAGCIDFGSSSKSVDLSQAAPGQTLTYTLRVQNSGDETSQNTVITDALSQNLENPGDITGGCL